MKVNFDNVPDADTPLWETLVEPGFYRMRIKEVDLFDAKKDGVPCFGLKLVPHSKDGVMFEVNDVIKLEGKSLSRLKVLYKALGMPHKGEIEILPNALKNQVVMVELERRASPKNPQKEIMGVTFAGYSDPNEEVKKKNATIDDSEIPF